MPDRRDMDVPSRTTATGDPVMERRTRIVLLGEDTILPHTAAVAQRWLVTPCSTVQELDAWLRQGRVDVLVVAPTRCEDVRPLAESLEQIDPLTVVVDGGGCGLAGAIGATWQTDALITAITLACHHRTTRIEQWVLRQGGTPAGVRACRDVDELVGAGEAMAGLRMRLRQVAEHDGPTLICGSLGTPLEATARWLHVSSHRGDEVLLPVDCGAASAGLFESRLFGHERGAFPGATTTRPGSPTLADGGTLLLRNIDQATAEQQSRIADLLTTCRWHREGGAVDCTADVRVIATLEHDVLHADARPRLDRRLLETFSTRIVRVPPLSERVEDLPELVRHMAMRLAPRYGIDRRMINAKVLDPLIASPLAGNDRELELACAQLLMQLKAGDTSMQATPSPVDQLVCDGASRTLADLERDAIVATLHHHHGHRRRSAEALGIGVRTLGLKLRQWKDARIVPETL